jgi:hypothetical protein
LAPSLTVTIFAPTELGSNDLFHIPQIKNHT